MTKTSVAIALTLCMSACAENRSVSPLVGSWCAENMRLELAADGTAQNAMPHSTRYGAWRLAEGDYESGVIAFDWTHIDERPEAYTERVSFYWGDGLELESESVGVLMHFEACR